MTDHPGSLATTLATWVYVLHASGAPASHDGVRGHCEAVAAATNAESGDAAGLSLVDAVQELLDGDDPAAVQAVGEALYGDRLAGGFDGEDRSDRTAAIRRYQFEVGLPWLARIWERSGDQVSPNWVIVERVTDEVTAMDPNPWDDIDEERHLPVADFHVLWELDACSAVRLAKA